jgi:trimeric autotransporter adhesin
MSNSASRALRVHGVGFAAIVVAVAATLLAVGWWTGTARAQQAETETVYLCADAGGALRLVSSPSSCKKNESSLALATEAALAVRDTRIANLEGRVTDLETANTTLQGKVGSLEALLTGVTRDTTTLRFTGMNLQIVNGEGNTSTANGQGNLIVGYNAQRSPQATRTGSHYLIVGDQHEWTNHGGILAGTRNTASGPYSSILGGMNNTASGLYSSMLGGMYNTASGDLASVSGGYFNTASGGYSSVSGGNANIASGSWAWVSGGSGNTANAGYSSVSGGNSNIASGYGSSVSGGDYNTTGPAGSYSSILGGRRNTVNTASACHPACD